MSLRELWVLDHSLRGLVLLHLLPKRSSRTRWEAGVPQLLLNKGQYAIRERDRRRSQDRARLFSSVISLRKGSFSSCSTSQQYQFFHPSVNACIFFCSLLSNASTTWLLLPPKGKKIGHLWKHSLWKSLTETAGCVLCNGWNSKIETKYSVFNTP